MERFRLIELFDLYSQFLTDKQKLIAKEYLYEDLSYQEIATNLNISKTAVYDTIKKVERLLIEFESKIGLLNFINNLKALHLSEVDLEIDNFLKGE